MSRPHETVERAREARLVQDEHVESPMVGSVFHNVLNFVRQLQNVVDNQDVIGLEHGIEIFELFQRERDHLNAGQFALGPWSLYAKVAGMLVGSWKKFWRCRTICVRKNVFPELLLQLQTLMLQRANGAYVSKPRVGGG